MTVDEYWAAVKAMGLRNAHRGHPEFDFICTTRDGAATQVTDPERLDPDQRAAIIALLRRRHGYEN
jgi:hypothetical protein